MKKIDFPENDGFLDEVPQDSQFDLLEQEDLSNAYIHEEAPVHAGLTDPETAEELSADDHAMYSAGLVHPEDAEFLYDDAQPGRGSR